MTEHNDNMTPEAAIEWLESELTSYQSYCDGDEAVIDGYDGLRLDDHIEYLAYHLPSIIAVLKGGIRK